MISELVKENRSYRRFYQDHAIAPEILKEFVNLARMTASGANLQPLKYIISCDLQKNAEIFSCLAWAGYLKDWPGPEDGERPSAYIVILGDTDISDNAGCDHGIAAQTIMLAAREKGLGGCMLGSINRKSLRNNLDIPSRLKILLVLAIGKPKEQVILETIDPNDSIKYWRDDKGIHHVPKRKLEDIIVTEYRS
jgi:nitroreductase